MSVVDGVDVVDVVVAAFATGAATANSTASRNVSQAYRRARRLVKITVQSYQHPSRHKHPLSWIGHSRVFGATVSTGLRDELDS